MTDTEKALALVAGGMAAYRAAKQVGIAPATVYVALKKQRAQMAGLCPCCGQKLPLDKQKFLTDNTR